VAVRGVCVLASDRLSRLEECTDVPPQVQGGIDWRPQPAVRLGLARVSGLGEDAARRIVEARERRRAAGIEPPFADVEDLAREARLERRELQALARADALAAIAGHRVEAAWQAVAIERMPALLVDARFDEPAIALPPMSEGEAIVADYASLGVPMGRHPLALLRGALDAFRVQPAAVLRGYPDGRLARASGLVTHRQRPDTARGVVFVTLEDDTGTVNVIVWPDVLERWRREILGARLMTVYGVWQADVATGGQVMHLVARRVVDHTALLGELTTRSRDFR
jgi:error-prone DNA polymerase